MKSPYLRLDYVGRTITCNEGKLEELKEKGFRYSFRNEPQVFVPPGTFMAEQDSFYDDERKENLYRFKY